MSPYGRLDTGQEKSGIPKFLITWLVTAVALWVAVNMVGGLRVSGGWADYLLIAIVFGLVNATLGLFTKIMTFPLVIVTFGIFILVVNALMLEVTAWLVPSFSVDGFWPAFWGAVVIALVSAALKTIFRPKRS